jgi:hypothetical protein
VNKDGKKPEKVNKKRLFQNSVSFDEAIAVFRPTAYKTAVFKGCSFKIEILKEPQKLNAVKPVL